MTITRNLQADFGAAYAGLTTVGYRLKNTDGSWAAARVAMDDEPAPGIIEISAGSYGAPVDLDDDFAGFIVWDTDVGSGIEASEPINPGLLEDQVDGLTVAELLQAILAVTLGVTSRDDDEITFYARDGITPVAVLTLNPLVPGEITASVIS